MQKGQLQKRSKTAEMSPDSARCDVDALPTMTTSDLRRVRNSQSLVPTQVSTGPHLYLASDSDTGLLVRAHDEQSRTDGRVYLATKRMFDLALGLPLLVISLPIIALAALALRIESPGSPIFVQTRLGRNGRPFRMVKLRGMYIDAPTRFAHLYDYSSKENLDFCFHIEVDPRVTPVGKFFRRTSIDELPNLWNVVTGEMSLVGPRPEIPEVMNLYGAYREEYLSVKPGVTCLSKCTGRDRLTKRETIEYDLQYVRRRNFRLDLRVLWRTFRGVVLRHDVY